MKYLKIYNSKLWCFTINIDELKTTVIYCSEKFHDNEAISLLQSLNSKSDCIEIDIPREKLDIKLKEQYPEYFI